MAESWRLFTLEVPWWEIAARAGLVYVTVLVGLRLGGKREPGQMSPADLVVILLIANAVQNAMVAPEVSAPGGLIAAGVLLGANAVLGRVSHQLPWLRRISEAEPVVSSAAVPSWPVK